MLRRGDNAPDAVDAGDTTLADMPDTPAPVFAARAFKSALFGTPQNEPRTRVRRSNTMTDEGTHTPKSKPHGILLTPGTGTSRPKRVSFGQDVGESTKPQQDASNIIKSGTAHKRTRLNEALEKARKDKERKVAAAKKVVSNHPNVEPSDDEWEEEEDIEVDEDNFCNHDITLDLNEPHSQSGRYWKEEFEKYHQEAKVEMGKLLKYKQLAKSYAQQKDAEAIDLAEMLRNEQEKVIKMEKKIAENASNILAHHNNSAEDAPPEVVAKLSKQTALAVQYRQRVTELEDELEEFLQDKQDEAENKGRNQRNASASPRTRKTLLETQRELRRARSQVKEVNSLREQVSSLKQQLRAAEKRASKAETGVKSDEHGTDRAQDLRAQLREAKQIARGKDEEIERLRKEFETFRKESQTHDEDTKAVLERAHTKIADLKKEVKTLKAAKSDPAASKLTHGPIERQQSEEDVEPPDEPNAATNSRVGGVSTRRAREKPKLGTATRSGSNGENPRTLRDKYHEDGQPSTTPVVTEPKTMSGALRERPTLEKPRWQPFVPRSPRNRAYLGEELSNQIRNAGVTPSEPKSKEVGLQDLSALAKSFSRSELADQKEAGDDHLQSRFVRLGGPEISSYNHGKGSTAGNTSKSRLPPERRAAAMARIEQRRAEKLKERARNGTDKENVQP